MRIVLPLLCVGALASLAQAAEALFREGKSLMDKGKYAEACAAFQGSYRKDPATSTLLNLANCREKNGQFASAWGAFIEAERRTRGSNDPAQQAINDLAKERFAALEPRLSYLTVNVPDSSRVDGLVITRDGEPVDAAEWNRSLPRTSAATSSRARRPATSRGGPPSSSPPSARPRPSPSRPGPRVPVKVPDPELEVVDTSPFTAKRKLAIGLAGLGVVGVGGGIILYFNANNLQDKAEAEVDDDEQRRLHDDANQRLLFAQIAGGVGVLALGAATYLWLTGKPTVIERPELAITPSIGPGGAGFVAVGTF
jgi:tetratricopeptide (TPR) repeat protein